MVAKLPLTVTGGPAGRAVGGRRQVTLMDWGNAIIRGRTKDSNGRVIGLEGDLHLEGDFKKTKKKLTWLSVDAPLVPLRLLDYGFLITKKKIEEDEKFEDFLATTTEFPTDAVADKHIDAVQKGTCPSTRPHLHEIPQLSATFSASTHALRMRWPPTVVAGSGSGDIIQLERRGFFVCDAKQPGEPIVLIAIPDGKAAPAPATPASVPVAPVAATAPA